MNDWSNKEWHTAVRLRLGEQRSFFRAQLRPYDIEATRRRIQDFCAAQRLHGLEAYLIFGSYDFLFTAWLHPLVLSQIPHKLASILQASEIPHEFVAERDPVHDHELNHLTPRQKSLLDTVLNVHTIRSVQRDGSAHKLFEDLRENGLIVDRETLPKETLRFFSTVAMPNPRPAALAGIRDEIATHLESRPVILTPTIFKGKGFCDILIDARVLPGHYFIIGDFTRKLIDICRKFEARVETYLPCEPGAFVEGDPWIDDSTFLANKGYDPLVASIIDEAYHVISPTADDVVRVLVHKAPTAHITLKAKALIHDVLKPVLYDDKAAAATSLFVCFTQIEGFLRLVQGRFLAKENLDPKEVYSQAGVKNPADRMTLGDVLQVYSTALKIRKSKDIDLADGWGPVVELRNDVSHGRYTLEMWRDSVPVILEHHCRLDSLIALVSNTTGEMGQFTYFGQ